MTLAFVPFVWKLKGWIDVARGAGHQVLINLQMNLRGYPRNDPGLFGLLTTFDTEQNRQRVHWALSQMTAYVAVIYYMGGVLQPIDQLCRPFYENWNTTV